jgi:hypothetical protein
VKHRMSEWVIGAAGLVLMSAGMARAAQPGYTYKSLFTTQQPFGDTKVSTETDEIEVGGVSNDGSATGLVGWGGNEGAYLITADGKNSLVLARQGDPNPTGGTWGGGANNKVSINDQGNVGFTFPNDRGDGAVSENYFVDRTDPAHPKWTLIATAGKTAVTGGTANDIVSFSTIGNSNKVVFTAALDAGTGTYIWDPKTLQISPVCPPGTKVGTNTIANAQRVQIGLNTDIVTFEGQVDGDASFGAYMWKDGVIAEVVRQGTPAPDATGKATAKNFNSLLGPIANVNGDVLTLGNTDDGWGVYLWTAADKKLVRIVGPGDTVDGKKVFTISASFRNDIRFGDDGSILFCAQFDDTGSGGDRGIYLRKPDGTLIPIAKKGQDLGNGIGAIDVLEGDIGGDSGLGFSTNGNIVFPMTNTAGARQLILATPPAAP